MKLPNWKRLNRQDFEEDFKPLVDKLAFLLNEQLEQITLGFNKNIDFNNLKQDLVYITLSVDSDGIPKIDTNFKNTLNSNIIGLKVINAQCTSDLTLRPTACPFITFAESGRIVNIVHVSGLQADETYKLTINTIV